MMKPRYKILCVFAVVFLSVIGCSDDRSLEEKFDDIELGMSYDEVRDIMGEPDVNESYDSDTNNALLLLLLDLGRIDNGSRWTAWMYYIPENMDTPLSSDDWALLIVFIKGKVTQDLRIS